MESDVRLCQWWRARNLVAAQTPSMRLPRLFAVGA